MGMNREKRRAARKRGELDDPAEGVTLQEYLSEPDQIVRRGEAWWMIQQALRLQEVKERHNRWYNRLIRKVRRWWKLHIVGPEIAGESMEDADEVPEPVVGATEEEAREQLREANA